MGICCAVPLDSEDSFDRLLPPVERLPRGFVGRESYFVGDALPVPAADEDLGGRLGPSPNSEISPRDGTLVLCDRVDCASSISPLLPILPCRGLPFSEPSRPLRDRSRCCFFFSPCNKFMMISRMRGRKLSRLACEASWLRVSSSIPRRSSGTFPRSVVSTPIALNAREAMLNS